MVIRCPECNTEWTVEARIDSPPQICPKPGCAKRARDLAVPWVADRLDREVRRLQAEVNALRALVLERPTTGPKVNWEPKSKSCDFIYRDRENGWGGVRCTLTPGHDGAHSYARLRWETSSVKCFKEPE